MLQVVTTGAYYPPVVTAGRFLLQEHPSRQRGHCAIYSQKQPQLPSSQEVCVLGGSDCVRFVLLFDQPSHYNFVRP